MCVVEEGADDGDPTRTSALQFSINIVFLFESLKRFGIMCEIFV